LRLKLLPLLLFLAPLAGAQTQIGGGVSGGGITPNSPLPAATSGPGPVFNVKNYGAKGNTQFSSANCTTTNGLSSVTCPGANFSSAANVGMRMNCGQVLGNGAFFPAGTTIVSVSSSTNVAVSNTSNGGSAGSSCYWGTVDDAPGGPIPTAVAAWQAAIASANAQQGAFNNNNHPGPAPVLYFPSGAYLVCNTAGGHSVIQFPTSNAFGGVILGDAPQETWLVPCDNGVSSGNTGWMIDGGCGLGIKNISIDGMYMPVTGVAINATCQHITENITISRWNGGSGFRANGGSGYNLNMNVNTSAPSSSAGIYCTACSDEWHSGGSSNNGSSSTSRNVLIQGAVGLNTGTGPRFTGNFLTDECGTATSCFEILNSHDVWLQGVSIFGGVPNCMHVDGNSFVHWNGGICGAFGQDNNIAGPAIDAGGTLLESDVRNVGTGTGKCLTNNGVLLDNGGNTCENQFSIASGTSTGTTAVLTLNNLGAAVNANCTVGDSIEVQGAQVAGYNGYFPFGITATSATTLTYLTQGSNLGAIGAAGSVTCRNLQSFSGNLPRALLNNPIPNTCYVTGTFAATTAAAPMCTFKVQNAANITYIKAASTTTTACTVAPVVTITDGTVSQTLTITTAKSIWDSSVDSSTGVGTTIFKPNGTITVSNTIGTCTTAPTNFSVSYNIAPILSN